jgi:hypothetical protein
MTPRKKQHLVWHKQLKKFFEEMGIRWCELCGTTEPPLDMAHSKKRFDIKTRDEYMEAAMLCRKHHNEIEFAGHEPMHKTILELIERRI